MTFIYALLMGCFLSGGTIGYDASLPPEVLTVKESTFIELEFELAYSCLFVGGIARVDMWFVGPSFSPNQLTSVITAGVRFDMFELGIRHSCFHPVMPGHEYATFNEQYEIRPYWEGAYDQIYLRISNGN